MEATDGMPQRVFVVDPALWGRGDYLRKRYAGLKTCKACKGKYTGCEPLGRRKRWLGTMRCAQAIFNARRTQKLHARWLAAYSEAWTSLMIKGHGCEGFIALYPVYGGEESICNYHWTL